MKPKQLTPEKKMRLLTWLRSVMELVESDEVTCVAAYLQKSEGGGGVAVQGELVDVDAIAGLTQVIDRIRAEARQTKGSH
jgi:hypothetical protein